MPFDFTNISGFGTESSFPKAILGDSIAIDPTPTIESYQIDKEITDNKQLRRGSISELD